MVALRRHGEHYLFRFVTEGLNPEEFDCRFERELQYFETTSRRFFCIECERARAGE